MESVNNTVYKVNFDEKDLCVDLYEVLRYLGYNKSQVTDEDKTLVENVLERERKEFKPMAVYAKYKISIDSDVVSLPYGKVKSRNLATNLAGCEQIYMMAVTIGAGFDRALKRNMVRSMAESAILQSVGAAAVESLCENMVSLLNEEASKNGERLRVRYSPGFGDYSLENQKGIFSVLKPEKYIGLTLRDTFVMTPEKSVTAVIGIEKI